MAANNMIPRGGPAKKSKSSAKDYFLLFVLVAIVLSILGHTSIPVVRELTGTPSSAVADHPPGKQNKTKIKKPKLPKRLLHLRAHHRLPHFRAHPLLRRALFYRRSYGGRLPLFGARRNSTQ